MNLMMVSIVNIFQAHSIVVNIFSITHILRVNINFGSVGLFFVSIFCSSYFDGVVVVFFYPK